MAVPKRIEHGRAKVSLVGIDTDATKAIGIFSDFSYQEGTTQTAVHALGQISPADIVEEPTGTVAFTATRWRALDKGPFKRIVDLASAGPLQFDVVEREDSSHTTVATIRSVLLAVEGVAVAGAGYLRRPAED